MALDILDNREHTENRVRVPAPTEEEVRVSDRVKVESLDLNNRDEFELALVAYFEQLQDPRLTAIGGIPVDTSERRWMVAIAIANVFDEVKNLGKSNKEDEDRVAKEQKEASEDSEDSDESSEPAIQTTDPRARLDSLLNKRDEDVNVRRMTTIQEDRKNVEQKQEDKRSETAKK